MKVLGGFPSHPDGVTPAWLNAELGLDVIGVRWEPIGTGQVGDSVRFHLEYPDGHGLATVAGKFAAADATSRSTAAMFGLYTKEVEFYRQAAPSLAVRVPKVHFAAVGDSGAEFILLFEDLGPARGGDQIAGCSLADALAAMAQAAALHAPSWHNRALLDAGWIQPPPRLAEKVGAMYPQAQVVWRERYAGVLEPEFMALSERFAEMGDLWFARSEAPECIIHGDFRLDNLLFDINGGTEAIAVLDWQTVTTGKAMVDIGYFLGCGIGDRLRRSHERELLDHYRSAMAARGVALAHDDIWDGYRIGALHGLSTAVFSAAFVERTPRGDANFLSMARGACALALEHDSLKELSR